MSPINLRWSESPHAQEHVLAKQDGVSINQLIATSLAETMPALLTRESVEARANRSSKQAFQGVLRKVKDRPVIVGAER